MTTSAPRFLEFFYFDAGGGHRSAATALRHVIAERFPHWRVEMVNLQDLLKPVDPVFRLTKIPSQNVYNALLKRGWTYGSVAMLRGLQKGIKLYAPQMEDILQQHWRRIRPDLVVSLIPNFNGVMFQALRRVHPDVPYVTVMTDLADYPPHFWQEKQDQFVICGSGRAVRQARLIGYRPERIFRVSGMILKPDFYRDDGKDRRSERERLGLDPDLPTALVMFGGNGSKASIKIVKRLERSDLRLQSIVMCGDNRKLQKKLQKRKSCQAVGFTEKVPEYMRLADFFIGKPGPGCISEALNSGLPVIVERNKHTLPQERYNTKWVEQREVGIVVKSFNQTAKAVRLLLQGDSLEQFRQNARRLNNRAVYQIPDAFEQITTYSARVIDCVEVRFGRDALAGDCSGTVIFDT
jgi:UDP-N-acetylglucosamine:LPS N-acetylglucosamine transferase